MDRLPIELNRDGLHEIAVPSSFETDGPFEVRLRNHGEAVHVHLNLEGELSRVTQLPESNHYVEPYSRRSVAIETHQVSAAVAGRLKIVTGHGTQSTYASVRLSPPGTVTNHVVVDESLAKPKRREPEPAPGEQLAAALPDAISLPGVGVIAVLVAIIIAGVLTESAAVVVGSLVVVGTLAAFVVAKGE